MTKDIKHLPDLKKQLESLKDEIWKIENPIPKFIHGERYYVPFPNDFFTGEDYMKELIFNGNNFRFESDTNETFIDMAYAIRLSKERRSKIFRSDEV